METVNDCLPWPAIVDYSIQAADGMIGHVEDVVADNEGWSVRCVEFEVLNWLSGKEVLVVPVSIPDRMIRPEYDVGRVKDLVDTCSSGRPKTVRRGQGFCMTLSDWNGA